MKEGYSVIVSLCDPALMYTNRDDTHVHTLTCWFWPRPVPLRWPAGARSAASPCGHLSPAPLPENQRTMMARRTSPFLGLSPAPPTLKEKESFHRLHSCNKPITYVCAHACSPPPCPLLSLLSRLPTLLHPLSSLGGRTLHKGTTCLQTHITRLVTSVQPP